MQKDSASPFTMFATRSVMCPGSAASAVSQPRASTASVTPRSARNFLISVSSSAINVLQLFSAGGIDLNMATRRGKGETEPMFKRSRALPEESTSFGPGPARHFAINNCLIRFPQPDEAGNGQGFRLGLLRCRAAAVERRRGKRLPAEADARLHYQSRGRAADLATDRRDGTGRAEA